jgi:hypothetical protein
MNVSIICSMEASLRFDQHAIRSDSAAQPRPVFITGSYRSGTSILTWAIGAHRHFRPLEETGWIGLLGTGALAGYSVVLDSPRNFFKIYGVSHGEYMAAVGEAIDTFIMRASAAGVQTPERRRWVDGTPENTAYMLLLRLLFPAAKFVFLVRDPIDVIASIKHFDRAGGASRNLVEAARAWDSLTLKGLLAYRAFGPDVVKIVPYAELVTDPAATLRDIFGFLSARYAPEAELMMHQRINSSSVTLAERTSVQRHMEGTAMGTRLRRRYDEALALKHAPWNQDDGALRELESLQRLPTSTFASPRFAFVRWILARLRDKIA